VQVRRAPGSKRILRFASNDTAGVIGASRPVAKERNGGRGYANPRDRPCRLRMTNVSFLPLSHHTNHIQKCLQYPAGQAPDLDPLCAKEKTRVIALVEPDVANVRTG